MNHLKPLPMLLACVVGAGAMLAIDPPTTADSLPQLVVRYSDLDLSRPSDLAVLYRRLQGAADTVCIPVASYDLVRAAAHRRCVQAVLEQSVSQVRSPGLRALHRASIGAHKRAAAHS